MTVVLGYDATHMNVGNLPKVDYVAGYTTGTSDIRWTSADWAAFHRAIRIDQDANAGDYSADVLDVERGAATNLNAGRWCKNHSGKRFPAIYTSQSNVTPLVNALIKSGVTGGVGLWVANWNLSQAEAASLVTSASGPFPIVGVQFLSTADYDVSVWSLEWFNSDLAPLPVPTIPKDDDMGILITKVNDTNYVLGGPHAPVVAITNIADQHALEAAGVPVAPLLSQALVEAVWGPLPQ